jgi:hypothetical protein
MEEAERIARDEHGSLKIAVISGNVLIIIIIIIIIIMGVLI